MKTKLLRKVRKRYSIEYFPLGLEMFQEFVEGPVMILYDYGLGRGPITCDLRKKNKEEAYNYLYGFLTEWIAYDYKEFGTRRNKKLKESKIKLWYKN